MPSSLHPRPGSGLLFLLVILTTSLTAAEQKPLLGQKGYQVGQAIPVSCLNRTADTGEHITDASTGQLSWVPAFVCNETARPLELHYGLERDLNCTIDFIDDAFFHLLEFYVHNDAPLTCRIPTRPLPPAVLPPADLAAATADQTDGQGSLSEMYTPLVLALAGTLQLSHLHVSPALNVLLHASGADRSIAAATAYSVPSPDHPPARIVIGDSLSLRLTVRWFSSPQLPPVRPASSALAAEGHVSLVTLLYCALSALASAAICVAYFRGVELPKRLRMHGKDRLGMGGGGERGLGGYGLGIGGGAGAGMNGYGYQGGFGKRD